MNGGGWAGFCAFPPSVCVSSALAGDVVPGTVAFLRRHFPGPCFPALGLIHIPGLWQSGIFIWSRATIQLLPHLKAFVYPFAYLYIFCHWQIYACVYIYIYLVVMDIYGKGICKRQLYGKRPSSCWSDLRKPTVRIMSRTEYFLSGGRRREGEETGLLDMGTKWTMNQKGKGGKAQTDWAGL